AELDPQAAGQSVFRDPERLSEAEDAAAKVREGGAPPPGPSAAFPLAAFAVGASNQVAVSAARAALERPGKKYNPLVLVGKTGLEERIVSRLEGGLVAELKEPDRDVKRAVLERLLTQQGANPEAALIDYLSDRPTDSVRSLVGMLQRVVSAAAAQDGPLSAGLAREVLEGQSARDTRRSSGFRTSGLVVSSLGGIKSREKVVWDWAD